MVDTLEHEFLSSGDDSMLLMLRLAQFVTCGLILGTNVPIIVFILNQESRTFLDWLIVFDCFLCLSNLQVVSRLGVHDYRFSFLVFFSFFCNLCSRLLTLGILVYRFTLVLGGSFFFSSYRKKILENIILLMILFTSLNLTGWNVYYREENKDFLCELKKIKLKKL